MYRINCHYSQFTKRKPFFFFLFLHYSLHQSQWSKRVSFKLLHKHFVCWSGFTSICIFNIQLINWSLHFSIKWIQTQTQNDILMYDVLCAITLSDTCIDVIISIQLNNIWASCMISWATIIIKSSSLNHHNFNWMKFE